MEIQYNSAVSATQTRQVERWAAANHANDIDSIAIHDKLVSVHGHRARWAIAAGTALRGDDLPGELDAAVTNMRRLFQQ